MKTVMCFGDSNTWGHVAVWPVPQEPFQRFDENTRWPKVMARELGSEYYVVEEGLGGRTTIFSTQAEPYKGGDTYLVPALLSHRPLDAVIIMLGTNDLRKEFGVTEANAMDGLRKLTAMILSRPECGANGKPPAILLAAPIRVRKPEGQQDHYEARGEERGVYLSEVYARQCRALAEELGCAYLDAGDVAEASLTDGLHMDGESHRRLGRYMAQKIREMLD